MHERYEEHIPRFGAENYEVKKQFERTRRRWEEYGKMKLKTIMQEDVKCISLADSSDVQWPLMKTVRNHRVPLKAGDFFS
jgi:hypothetical protein